MDFFRRLLAAPSPSGFEEAARRVWREEVGTFVDEIRTGPHGSEVAKLSGKDEDTRILLLGHIDEIGIIVRYIDDNGFLYFGNVGGIDPATLVSQPVRLLGTKGIIEGVIGKVAIHLLKPDERKGAPELHDMWIDIGAKSKVEAEEIAPIGTPAVVGGDSTELLNGRISARCFDNKMGAYIVAEVLRKLAERRDELFATVYGAATVQEETGVFDAGMVAYGVEPSAAIAIDVSHSVDVPGTDKRRYGDAALGKGPILNIGVRTSNRLAEDFQMAAQSRGINLQIEAETGRHATDADAASIVRQGIPVITVGAPLRYMHTGVEVMEMADIDALVEVLLAYVLRVKAPKDYRP